MFASTKPDKIIYALIYLIYMTDDRYLNTASWFGQVGLGTQYDMPSTLQQLMNTGYLKEVGL